MTSADVRAGLRALWWLVLLRGLLAVAFGLFALFAPSTALLALVYVFGFYALLDGITAIVVGIRSRGEPNWVWLIVQGVVSVIAGIVAFAWPGVTVFVMLVLIAIWSILLGVTAIVGAFAARRQGSSTWVWPLVVGIVAILFGIVLFAQPAAGLTGLLWIVGAFSLVFGIVIVVWSFQLRRAVGKASNRVT